MNEKPKEATTFAKTLAQILVHCGRNNDEDGCQLIVGILEILGSHILTAIEEIDLFVTESGETSSAETAYLLRSEFNSNEVESAKAAGQWAGSREESFQLAKKMVEEISVEKPLALTPKIKQNDVCTIVKTTYADDGVKEMTDPSELSEHKTQPAKESACNAEFSLEQVIERCNKIDSRIVNDHKLRTEELKSLVQDLRGRSFGGLQANRMVATSLESLAEKLGLRFACPRQIKEKDAQGEVHVTTCGSPATLGCNVGVRSPDGLFYFQHPLESGRWAVHASSKTFPDHFMLVPELPDRRKRRIPIQPSGPGLG